MKLHLPRGCIRLALAGLGYGVAAGCAPAGGSYHRPLEPVADRMVRAYADLASGRFLIIADFEAVEQGAIFRLAVPTAAAYVGIVPERARPETGAGSLKARFAGEKQELIVEDSGQGNWTLPKDWSRFHLLLVSVYSPRMVAGFVLAVRSGTDKPRECVQRGLVLREGWNLLRIDIDDLAERIDVADVRQLRFGCPATDSPVDLYFDDMVLADNGRDVLGSPSGPPGDLYVRTEGRRIRVGAVERFELAFSRGRITQWFDLGADPNRIHNLSGGGPVGPAPVWVAEDLDTATPLDEESGWERFGVGVEAFQKLVEASAVRAIVWGEWRFGPPAAVTSAAGTEGPFCRWVYAVYPTGRVCFEFAGTAGAPGGTADRLGYVVSCAEGKGFRRSVFSTAEGGGASSGTATTNGVLYHRDGTSQADLLFSFFRATTAPLARAIRHNEEPRMGTLFYGGSPSGIAVWAGMINVWPHDIDGLPQALPIATDYANPMPVTTDAGRLVPTDPGDLDNDGFNEARGHYTLEPDGNAVKVRLDGHRRMRFNPAFKIMDTADCDVWAYVDGLEIRPIARDADNNAIFQIPRVLDRETLVEVTTRRKTAPSTQPG